MHFVACVHVSLLHCYYVDRHNNSSAAQQECHRCICMLSDSPNRTVTYSEPYTLYPECRKEACCIV